MIWVAGGLAAVLVLVLGSRASAKEGPSLLTEEEVANARRNVSRFDWAEKELERVLALCQPWMARSDEAVWKLVTGQEVPRGIHVNANLGCPSCGREVYRFGNYPWKVSLDRPWKLECPSCGEVWPKNDFAAFHESGLGPGGVFRRDRADESLLFNAEHPDPQDPLRGFAVDDGKGWVDEKGNRWWFVAYYSHYCTWAELRKAAQALGLAYLYTGDRAYAHKGAVILDRIADVYPEMDLAPYSEMGLYNSHGGSGQGRIVGCIWETGVAEELARAYDMVYAGMEGDEKLVAFLSAQAQAWDLENEKASVAQIRENIETNLLREFIDSCQDRRIRGNEGMTQTAMATAAVVLDDPEETPEALDWLFEPEGGHIAATLIGQVDRDGVGNEAAPGYCFIWKNLFWRCARVLERGRKHQDFDLHRDFPRLRKMYAAPYRLTALDRYTPHIGDSGNTGNPGMTAVDLDVVVDAFRRFGDAGFAQVAYVVNGRTADGLHTEVTDAEPEAVQEAIRKVVAEAGELDLGCENLDGYGFTAFRSGSGEDRRAAWLYYGRNTGHGHRDRLNFGMYYRGMDVLPDLGYPEYADGRWPKRVGWTLNTISHNTVMVNRHHQERSWVGHCRLYEASTGVGVVEVASPEVYPETRDYRRTLAMVDLSDADSCLVDFFRVSGGEEHVLSFHAGEGEATVGGIELTPQKEGTYAGTEIPFGRHYDGPPDGRYRGSGYAYLYGVARAERTGPGWWADWTLADTWKTVTGDAPVHVRFRALSPACDTALAWGDPPQNKPGNPRRLRYLLQRNTGRDCRSLFVSVVEPYSGDRPVLEGVERVDLGLAQDDLTAAAVRLLGPNGRVDLVLSSDDPQTLFNLGHGVQVAARFAWVSLVDGHPRSAFLVGGAMAELPGGVLTVERAGYGGRVLEMHRDEMGPAWIEVDADLPVGEKLAGAEIRIANDGVRDACYPIRQVLPGPREHGMVDVGDQTFVRGLQSEGAEGYVYNFASGDRFEIQTAVHLRFGESGPEPVRATTGFAWKG